MVTNFFKVIFQLILNNIWIIMQLFLNQNLIHFIVHILIFIYSFVGKNNLLIRVLNFKFVGLLNLGCLQLVSQFWMILCPHNLNVNKIFSCIIIDLLLCSLSLVLTKMVKYLVISLDKMFLNQMVDLLLRVVFFISIFISKIILFIMSLFLFDFRFALLLLLPYLQNC